MCPPQAQKIRRRRQYIVFIIYIYVRKKTVMPLENKTVFFLFFFFESKIDPRSIDYSKSSFVFVFCSVIVRTSFPVSNWENLSWSKSLILNPVNTPMVTSKQNLYSSSLSSFEMRDLKSSQSIELVVVFWPRKLIVIIYG